MNEQIKQFQKAFNGYIDVKEGWDEEEWQKVWDYVANEVGEQIAKEIEAHQLIGHQSWPSNLLQILKLNQEQFAAIARGQK